MIGDMAEPLIYSWNNHKHCTNAATAPCLLLVVAWSQILGCVLARRRPGIALGLALQRELLACSSACLLLF